MKPLISPDKLPPGWSPVLLIDLSVGGYQHVSGATIRFSLVESNRVWLAFEHANGFTCASGAWRVPLNDGFAIWNKIFDDPDAMQHVLNNRNVIYNVNLSSGVQCLPKGWS